MPETCQGGLKPVFGTEPSTIFVFRKGRNDVEEQAHEAQVVAAVKQMEAGQSY